MSGVEPSTLPDPDAGPEPSGTEVGPPPAHALAPDGPGTDPGSLPRRADLAPRRTIGPRAAAFWATHRTGLLVAAVATVGLRLVTEWIGLVNQFGTSFPHQVARTPSLLVQVWSHWDVGYYISIARWGYAGRTVIPGQAPHGIAFAPLYPFGIRAVHDVTGAGWMTSAELLSAVSLFVAVAALHRLAVLRGGRDVASASAMMLVAFPTAFFLLAPYPESLCLALVALALVCAESQRWLLAGVLAAGASMTKYYMVIAAVALCVEVWECRRVAKGTGPAGGWTTRSADYVKVAAPTAVVFGGWMVYQWVHLGSPFAFARAQTIEWHRHLGTPWTLAVRTASDVVHLRFLDTSVASVTEFYDVFTILMLIGAAVYVYRNTSRALGALLAMGCAVFTFQDILQGVTREALVFAPFFLALGTWTANRRWLERLLLAAFIPAGYFLIQRYVTGAFAG